MAERHTGKLDPPINDWAVLAEEASIWGLPLLMMGHHLRAAEAACVPLNRFIMDSEVATPRSHAVGPNIDTLNGRAWLDLEAGPQVIGVPDTGERYYSVQLQDMYMNAFAYIGRRTTGTIAGAFVITPPDFAGVLPAGVTEIRATKRKVLAFVRTLVRGPADLAAARAINAAFTLGPLSAYPAERHAAFMGSGALDAFQPAGRSAAKRCRMRILRNWAPPASASWIDWSGLFPCVLSGRHRGLAERCQPLSPAFPERADAAGRCVLVADLVGQQIRPVRKPARTLRHTRPDTGATLQHGWFARHPDTGGRARGRHFQLAAGTSGRLSVDGAGLSTTGQCAGLQLRTPGIGDHRQRLTGVANVFRASPVIWKNRCSGPRPLSRPVFTPEALRAAAEQRASHDDYDSDSYMQALEPLLYSIAHEADLNAAGMGEIHGRIVAALADRLTVVAWEKACPELVSMPVRAPLVILGLPRTGSSILHETLAVAPGLRTPRIWEVRDYTLAHSVTDPRAEARVQQIEANIARYNQAAPGYAAIHYEDAFVPMECLALTVLDLVTSQFATVAWAPAYRNFLLSHDARVTYQWHRCALRYLQANTPGARWVLKAPMHSLYIPALLETYPDAMIIQTHRAPLAVIGSLCSLYATLRHALSDRVDVAGQAQADAAYPAATIQRTVDYRQKHSEVAGRFYDMAFKDFMADQLGTLRRIHAHFGLPFTDAAQDAMATYLKNRPREKYCKHTYTLEQFGLKAEGLTPLFADYVAQYAAFL